MSRAGVVSRGRQLWANVARRLSSHGVEFVPFLTVGCLVAGFWCALSVPTIVHAMGTRDEAARDAAPATHEPVRPKVALRVIASIGGATMPELRHTRAQAKRSHARIPVTHR